MMPVYPASDPHERCPDRHNESIRCMGTINHGGPHWANTNGRNGVRWGLHDYGCLIGIEAGYVCMEGAHQAHTMHRGTDPSGRRATWGDPEPI